MKIVTRLLSPAIAAALFVLASVVMLSPASAEFRIDSLDNDFPAEIEEAAAEGKRLVIFFHQPGCPYCDKMRARVHPAPKVFDYFSEHFVMIESNIRGNLEVVMPDGAVGTERDLARQERVRATPVFVFYDEQGNSVLRTTGFIGVEYFYLAGKYVVDEVYKTNKSYFRYVKDRN